MILADAPLYASMLLTSASGLAFLKTELVRSRKSPPRIMVYGTQDAEIQKSHA